MPENEKLLHFLVRRMLPARIAKLPRLHPLGVFFLVLRRRVVAVLAIPALQRNNLAHRLLPLVHRACRHRLAHTYVHRQDIFPPNQEDMRSVFVF